MLIALETPDGPHRALLGPNVNSNRSSSGALTIHLSHFARGALEEPVLLSVLWFNSMTAVLDNGVIVRE